MKLYLLLLSLLLLQCVFLVSSLRKKQGKASVSGSSTDSEEDVEVLSTKELHEKMSKLNHNNFDEEKPTDEELANLEKEYVDLERKVALNTKLYGEMSRERAKALHALGGNLYKQQRYEAVVETAKEIVRIHETLDGPESKATADALGNLASVAFRVKDIVTCHHSIRRALYNLLLIYEEESKEIMLHRGKMLTFQVPYAKVDPGLSYDDYQFEL